MNEENNCCIPCKLRSLLTNKLDGVFLEMHDLFEKENEPMDVSYVWHELVGWGLEQLANSNASDEAIKDFIYTDLKKSFDLIIGQREVNIKETNEGDNDEQ